MRKRYLVQVAAMNLGVALRALLGYGTPRGLAEARKGLALLFAMLTARVVAVVTRIAKVGIGRGRRRLAAPSGWYDAPELLAA